MGATERALFGPAAEFIEAAEQREEAMGGGVKLRGEFSDFIGKAFGRYETGRGADAGFCTMRYFACVGSRGWGAVR